MISTNIIFSVLIISATLSAISNAILRKFSKSYSFLIDQPDKHRKFHARPTPLTGGLGIYMGMLISCFVILNLVNQNYDQLIYIVPYLLFSFICIAVFIIDDLFNISPKLRLILQSSIIGGLLLATGIKITYLPDLLGFGDINLGFASIPFTIICCIGLMNAYNMIDGLNGLCSALAINTLFFIFLDNLSIGPILIIGAVLGFILYNVGLFGKKRTIFLGDNGSNFLGLTVAVACIYYASNINKYNFGTTSAVTMLWFVALPLWDCIRVIITRLLAGKGPLTPSRDHIHHILLRFNYEPQNVVKILIIISLVLSLFGLTLENMFYDTPYVSFYSFVFCSLVYLILCIKLIKINNDAKKQTQL